MYRGSRLAASLLLVLTGAAALAGALLVLPTSAATGGPVLIPAAIAFGLAHLVALVGVARARDWGRELAILIAEFGGGLAIVGVVAAAIGATPAGASQAESVGFLAWTTAMYVLLGIAAGRVPALAGLTEIARERVLRGPGFGYEAVAA